MSIPVYYLSLPHDMSGSRSKNRFRAELLWGVSKILDLMEEDQDFTMVFDYACDIEVHYENGFEFFQIKTHGRSKSYTTKRLTKIEGKNSILGKLYVLVKDSFPGEVRVAVVSNIPYSSMPADLLVNCFLKLPHKDKKEITTALKEELRIESVDFSKLFYVQTNLDLEHPDDAVRGKLTFAFEKIKKCEPTNPNALYRLIVDTVSEKACYEYSAVDYDEILRLKGLNRKQFDELLDLHAEKSKTGISAATRYIDQLSKLNSCKAKLVELRNNLYEYETLLHEMSSLSSKNEKEISQLNEHICPECGSVLRDTTSLRCKRYNLAEDIVTVKNELQVAIQNASFEIEKEETKYQKLLDQLSAYEEKLKLNTKQANDVIRYKGLCEIREGLISERHDVLEYIDEEEEKLKEVSKEIKKYSEKKKHIEEKYYELLATYRTKFGLNEIEPEKFKKLTNNFTASGSNKNIATVIWYLAVLNLRREFNPGSIEFPVVFDSPNNVETDNVKKHALLQYILDNASDSQFILSSIGFNASEFSYAGSINVIVLENAKYSLLDEKVFLENEKLLNDLCDAEK